MLIDSIECLDEGRRATLRARIRPDHADAARTLWFRFEGFEAAPQPLADPFVTAMLPFCMYTAEACRADAPVSPALRDNLARGQAVLADWYDCMTPVAVRAADAAAPAAPAAGVACCFSGGVDSWYSLLRNRRRVTHLLLVRGFDIGLSNHELWAATCRRHRRLAARLGLRLVTCETNLRGVADLGRAGWGPSGVGDFWGRCLHGAALAAVAQPLAGDIGTLIVPATHTAGHMPPWGSSPRLDPLWSNGRVGIEHDGCESGRFAKIRRIAACDMALANLRVCHNDTADINCGRCEKCIRTMLALDLCGALDRAETFPDRRALRRLRRLEVPPHLRHHYEALLLAARRLRRPGRERQIEIVLGRRRSLERMTARLVRALRRNLASRRSLSAAP